MPTGLRYAKKIGYVLGFTDYLPIYRYACSFVCAQNYKGYFLPDFNLGFHSYYLPDPEKPAGLR